MKRMRRLAVLACLLAAILAVGGCGGSARMASDLLLGRESINRVEVHREQRGAPAAEVTEPGRIQELLTLLDGVEVRRLSRAEDAQFMQNGRRLLEQGLYRVNLKGPGNPEQRGYFIIFAGGDMYIVDPQTFLEPRRTISYQSLVPQKELYDWLKALPGQDAEAPGREEAAGPSVLSQIGAGDKLLRQRGRAEEDCFFTLYDPATGQEQTIVGAAARARLQSISADEVQFEARGYNDPHVRTFPYRITYHVKSGETATAPIFLPLDKGLYFGGQGQSRLLADLRVDDQGLSFFFDVRPEALGREYPGPALVHPPGQGPVRAG